jgi:hypothetical protein
LARFERSEAGQSQKFALSEPDFTRNASFHTVCKKIAPRGIADKIRRERGFRPSKKNSAPRDIPLKIEGGLRMFETLSSDEARLLEIPVETPIKNASRRLESRSPSVHNGAHPIKNPVDDLRASAKGVACFS